MRRKTVKFNNADSPKFIVELRKRVNQHFKDNGITRYGNKAMHRKTVFMILLYLVPFIIICTGLVQSSILVILLWILVGLGMAGIGLSIMHDANHGAYSKSQKVNTRLGYLMNVLGGNHITWKVQHNVLHHSFTNVDGLDEDIELPVMRFSPNQKRYKIFRFQAYYASFFYALLTIFKGFVKDFKQLRDYGKRGLLEKQGTTTTKAVIGAIFMKIIYVAVILVLPILLTGKISLMVWGFLTMHFVCGLILAYIFQSAHVIEDTQFYEPSEDDTVENSWAILQLRTTANFAHGSKWFSWFIGGLNYQVEHHLFPNICHIHYKDLAPIVKQTAEEYGVTYHEFKTFGGAIASHLRLLNRLGKE